MNSAHSLPILSLHEEGCVELSCECPLLVLGDQEHRDDCVIVPPIVLWAHLHLPIVLDKVTLLHDHLDEISILETVSHIVGQLVSILIGDARVPTKMEENLEFIIRQCQVIDEELEFVNLERCQFGVQFIHYLVHIASMFANDDPQSIPSLVTDDLHLESLFCLWEDQNSLT